eukprot:1158443-Pelagomonas_calceolata.AAC.5
MQYTSLQGLLTHKVPGATHAEHGHLSTQRSQQLTPPLAAYHIRHHPWPPINSALAAAGTTYDHLSYKTPSTVAYQLSTCSSICNATFSAASFCGRYPCLAIRDFGLTLEHASSASQE